MGAQPPVFAGMPVAAPPRLDDVVSRRDEHGHDLTMRIERPIDSTRQFACYEASTPAGVLRLEVDQVRVRHAADAALALLRADELLWALQCWTRLPLPWRWVEHPAADLGASHLRTPWQLPADPEATRPPTVRASLATRGEAGALFWPWALLRALPAPEGLLAPCLSWPDVDAVLSAAVLHLDADELAQLEPGGAVLLRPSCTRPWTGHLRMQAEAVGAGVPVDLSRPKSPRLILPTAEASPTPCAQPASIDCEVRLALPGPIPVATLAGWHAGQPLATGDQASLWRTASPRGPATCLAHGHLMPWGDGWAMALDMLCDAAVAATLAATDR
jgi:hypothetical protein